MTEFDMFSEGPDQESLPSSGDDLQLMKLDNAVADAQGNLRVALVEHEVLAGSDDIDPVKLAEAEERVAKAERDVELAQEVARAAVEQNVVGPAAEKGDEGEPSAPEFASVYEFVEDHFAVLYARKWKLAGTQRIWCPQWWAHPEAVSRLEAIWRAFESLRLDPTLGMSVWWRDHVDPHMAVLTNSDGPFDGCSVDSGHQPAVAAIPVELMPDSAVRAAMSAH